MDNKTNHDIKQDPEAKNKSKRLIEIDIIKGLAVINMVFKAKFIFSSNKYGNFSFLLSLTLYGNQGVPY